MMIDEKAISPWRLVIGVVLYSLSALPVLSDTPSVPTPATNTTSITYATRIESVVWEFEGSKFSCSLSHNIDGFGAAVFERQAGLSTQFHLLSQSPRMQSGKADLISHPPVWLTHYPAEVIAQLKVNHGAIPVQVKRKTSERMLAELEKGMDLHVIRQPWYGDNATLKIIIPSVGFRKVYNEYLACLGNLLPVNFSQVERKSLYYSDGAEELSRKNKNYLDKVSTYLLEDPSVKVVYIDAHTDSTGIRNDNLLKSQQWAERVRDYLLSKGIPEQLLVTRWHGERYQIATNQTKAGRAKNRRITVRLSKKPQVVTPTPAASTPAKVEQQPTPENLADEEV